MIAALYVDTVFGPYVSIPGISCWGFATKDGRQLDMLAPTIDARLYAGPWPIIAHPPCGPWGRFRRRYKGGEGDRDCALRAVDQVREWGGVIEHPAYSTLWQYCGLPYPKDRSDRYNGWTLRIDQVDFGHPAKKPTWLYFCKIAPSDIPPLPDPGVPIKCMVRKKTNPHNLPEVPKKDRHKTPFSLALWLVRAVSNVRA